MLVFIYNLSARSPNGQFLPALPQTRDLDPNRRYYAAASIICKFLLRHCKSTETSAQQVSYT